MDSCIFYDIATTVIRSIQLLSSTWLILIVVQSLSLGRQYFKGVLYVAFFAMNVVTTAFGVITLKEMYRTSKPWMEELLHSPLWPATIVYLPPFKICSSVAPDSTRWLYLSQVNTTLKGKRWTYS